MVFLDSIFCLNTSRDCGNCEEKPGIHHVKSAVDSVKKTIIKIIRRKAIEESQKNIGNCEVTPQSIWPVVKSLIKRDRPKAPTAIHGPLGLKYQPLEKTSTIADCLENQFTHQCDENRKRRVEARVQAVLEVEDDNPLENVRPCDIKKLINLLKLERHLELIFPCIVYVLSRHSIIA
jgi:hypothetical protein